MIEAFLDTDILVDCLRGLPPATAWLAEVAHDSFRIPGVVAMELLAGCRDRPDLDRTTKLLTVFGVVWHESNEFSMAFEIMKTHRLRTALSIPDCLIAATVLNRNGVLFTFNTKHYQVIEGLDVRLPYTKPPR
jgi:predicted nucleic acid-binding protein